jgi:hypothetical protein
VNRRRDGPERTWLFSAVSDTTEQSVAQLWRWTLTSGENTVSSARLFGTLSDCVRDAQVHGFTGDVDATAGSFSKGRYEILTRDVAS